MKNTYTTIKLFTMLICLVVVKLGAQPLSGVYTIDNTQATAGTNFNSFNAFASAINANGVSGPVTVNVLGNGTYNEQVQFMQPSGVTSTNKVTINGNNNLITFLSNNSAQPWTIAMNGTDWFTIQDLNVQGTGATYAFPLVLFGGADNNVFTNCTFSCNPNQGTGTTQIPVVISGSGTSYATASNSGNYNTFERCSTFGGYFGASMYHTTTEGQYGQGNKWIKCAFRDYYVYGTYFYYHENGVIQDCISERPTRTNHTTAYGILLSIASGWVIEGNTVQKLYELNPTYTGQIIGIYVAGNTSTTYNGAKNIVRNNVVKDLRSGGTLYGYYMLYINGDVFNNTVSINDPTSTATGATWGIYYTTTGNKYINSANNLIYINRGGTGQKNGIYYGTTAMVTSNNNNIWMGPSGTNNYAGYVNGANQISLLNLQASSQQEATTYSIDPVFVNAQTDPTPTSATFNNLATPLGIVFDYNGAVRNPSTPDIGAIEFLTPVCNGSPGLNTVNAPTFAVCPGESVALGLGTLNANSGFTYQWQVSNLSSVGPFNNIPGATSLFYTAPTVTANTWYNVVMTCTAPGGSSANYVGQVQVAGPTSSTVPYYEDFEGIGLPGRLPNCSWSAPGLGSGFTTYNSAASNNRQPHSGTSFAAFSAPTATNHVYTSPIWMDAGITYSAALHWATEYLGYSNWSNLALLVGPNQSPAGLTTIASVGPAMSGPYQLLDGTFTVPSSGFYHIAIRATASSGSALYLSFDDLSVTIPCQGPGASNSPTLQLAASSNTICEGEAVNLTVNGADIYTWSNAASGPGIVESPKVNTLYTVWGTNTLTGCTATLGEMIYVNKAPVMYVVASSPTTCAGTPINLTAFGQDVISFSWNTSATGPVITVAPTGNTTYTVIGTNSFGCTGIASQMVGVSPLPNVNASSTIPDVACHTEAVQLTATGGVTYQWMSSVTGIMYSGNPITVVPGVTTVFSVTATNAQGCSNKTTITQNAMECLGLTGMGALKGLRVYPNPTSGAFSIEVNTTSMKTVEVTDITGRVVLASSSVAEQIQLNIGDLANGIYYVKIQSENNLEVIKVTKQ